MIEFIIVVLFVIYLWVSCEYNKVKNERENTEGSTTQTNYTSQQQLPKSKNFAFSEFKAKDGSNIPAVLYGNLQVLINNLQKIRDSLGEPIKVLIAYKSKKLNEMLKGTQDSYHMKAMASDIAVKGMTSLQLFQFIEYHIQIGNVKDGGLGLYDDYVHYDIGDVHRRWDNRKIYKMPKQFLHSDAQGDF